MSKHTTTTTTTSSTWWLLTFFVLLTFLANFSPILALPTTTSSTTSSITNPGLEKRQAPSQMYIYFPYLQTASLNMTTFILPIPLSKAYSLASPYNLLLNHNLPTSVIPSGYFPLQVVLGYYYDIRQKLVLGLLPFQVQQLSMVEVYLPFVDVLGGGKAFRRSVKTYVDQLIPQLVGGVTQFTNTQLAYFDPAHAAYKAGGGNTLSFAAAQGLINTVDGPGLVSPLIQSVFSRSTSSPVSADTFKSMLDQPYYTTPGAGCNYIDLYYNFTNANPSYVNGNLQAFSPLIDSNTNVATAYGYTAATQAMGVAIFAVCLQQLRLSRSLGCVKSARKNGVRGDVGDPSC